MEWTDESILAFIKEYRDRPVLWDTNDEHYKLTSRKIEAWNKISSLLDVSVAELKRKMNSLLASYRRERQKAVVEAAKTGQSPESYQSTWFAYRNFDFLKDKYQPKPPRNSSVEVYSWNRHGEEDAKMREEDAESFEYDMGLTEVGQEDSIECDRLESDGSNAHYDRYNPHHLNNPIGWTPPFLSNITFLYQRKRQRPVMWEARRDEYDAYGEYIGAKLRALDRRSAAYVQKAFSDILYEAEMGSLANQNASSMFLVHNNHHHWAENNRQSTSSSPQPSTNHKAASPPPPNNSSDK